jgi:hypothetical protein
MFSQGGDGALPVTVRRAKRENWGLGKDPLGSTITYLQVLRTWMFSQLFRQKYGVIRLVSEHQINQLQSSDGALPTTARRAKRENGGLGEDPPGSTITYRQVLRTWMFSQLFRKKNGVIRLVSEHQINQLHSSDGALPTTARRAKRENGGLGEDPLGNAITNQQVLRTCILRS